MIYYRGDYFAVIHARRSPEVLKLYAPGSAARLSPVCRTTFARSVVPEVNLTDEPDKVTCPDCLELLARDSQQRLLSFFGL